jgi:hypothetical protein
MNLQLFIRDRLIKSVPIDMELASNPQYLNEKLKELEEQHKDLIRESGIKPTFFLESRPIMHIRERKK